MKETERKVKEIEGLYLRLNLREAARNLGRPLVIANYVCDLDDVIAKKEEGGEFQVARELKNDPDWRLFQELTAQSDAIITGAGYLKRYAAKGEAAENVLDQFSEGAEFAKLGQWRQEHGLKRNPDIVIVSRSMDFDIPKSAMSAGRNIIIATTYSGADSAKAGQFRKAGAIVVGSGEEGVDGKILIKKILSGRGYSVIKMTTGPRVLDILLKGKTLDEIFITRVQRKIEAPKDNVQTVLLNGKKLDDLQGFKYKRLFYLEEVKASDGKLISEEFGVYEKKGLPVSLTL